MRQSREPWNPFFSSLSRKRTIESFYSILEKAKCLGILLLHPREDREPKSDAEEDLLQSHQGTKKAT
ncbi:hypothetical protein KFK09_024057 [Dendrobium nobile]|uniref:Uncharacterized protein n=1 Tax=Dendrobium nobile TaxID=94219 RepID=A0A8T3ACQ2_DENNO|nr:hypothetical protein KFK09_024057 [Dendrobium nobile]